MLAFVLWVLWAFQMCCNLRRAVRDFELNVLELEGERNFVLGLRTTVSGLAKVAIFTTNVDAENQTLINHKCVCGALNRHFCQTRVIGCPSVGFACLFVLGCVLVRWLGSSFAFFSVGLCFGKKCKCATKSLGQYSSFHKISSQPLAY